MSKNLISIVLTLYNKAPFIEETIFSIYKQTYTNRELIIVDDCSTDGSFEIAKSFCEKLGITEKCKFLQNEQNLRVAKTFERGLEEAKGDWISVQDGDDILMKNKLEENLKFCEGRNLKFCYSDMVTINEQNNILPLSGMELFSIKVHKKQQLSDCIYGSCAIGTSIFFSKIIGDKLKKAGFPTKIYQDRWITLYTSLQGYEMGYIDKKLVYYRRCINCITWGRIEDKKKKNNEECLHGRIKIFQEVYDVMNYIVTEKCYTIPEQLERLREYIDIYKNFITFLKSKKIFLPLKLLKLPFIKKGEFGYRIIIIQIRKLLYRFSNSFQKK